LILDEERDHSGWKIKLIKEVFVMIVAIHGTKVVGAEPKAEFSFGFLGAGASVDHVANRLASLST